MFWMNQFDPKTNATYQKYLYSNYFLNLIKICSTFLVIEGKNLNFLYTIDLYKSSLIDYSNLVFK